MIRLFSSILALIKRDFQITYRNFSDILSIFIFFLLAVIIFVFSIGSDKEIFNEISIGILWTLILLSNTLTLRKFFQNDFDDNNIILFHMSGMSYEIIVIIKIVTIWFFFSNSFFYSNCCWKYFIKYRFCKYEINIIKFFNWVTNYNLHFINIQLYEFIE